MLKLTEADFEYMDGYPPTCFANDHLPGFGDMIDIYVIATNNTMTRKQLDIYNAFKESHSKYAMEIEEYILNNLTSSELKKADEISKSQLFFDVVQIPQENSKKYDLVLVCGKQYKKFWGRKSIDIRVEFLANQIQSIKRTK